jgi:hypothetical protein
MTTQKLVCRAHGAKKRLVIVLIRTNKGTLQHQTRTQVDFMNSKSQRVKSILHLPAWTLLIALAWFLWLSGPEKSLIVGSKVSVVVFGLKSIFLKDCGWNGRALLHERTLLLFSLPSCHR